ncbi:hypothetical protein CCM_06638 [Cordyceps militaris CM01]|uniref:Uncharacterized protein n=1 Tax=Cordyceps militaris (strain CM01) TaxID=983644 RepID=G3JN37_CORMM|nr:uncharacterized protein CCM_06638 [Cordyceps militaris CM01]EGX90219.1 hypothetical protein CCM_06638 [Cordyceps militaris CM01]
MCGPSPAILRLLEMALDIAFDRRDRDSSKTFFTPATRPLPENCMTLQFLSTSGSRLASIRSVTSHDIAGATYTLGDTNRTVNDIDNIGHSLT